MFATGGYDAQQSDADNRAVGGGGAVGDDRRGGVPDATFETPTRAAELDRRTTSTGTTSTQPGDVHLSAVAARRGAIQTLVDALTATRSRAPTTWRRRADAARVRAGDRRLLLGLERRGGARVDEPVRSRRCSARGRGSTSDAIAMQLDHLLGRNIYDRTQVTVVGYHPPHPAPPPPVGRRHRRRSRGQGCWSAARSPGRHRRRPGDDVAGRRTSLNEIAINWNGALVYAAALLPPLDRPSPVPLTRGGASVGQPRGGDVAPVLSACASSGSSSTSGALEAEAGVAIARLVGACRAPRSGSPPRR